MNLLNLERVMRHIEFPEDAVLSLLAFARRITESPYAGAWFRLAEDFMSDSPDFHGCCCRAADISRQLEDSTGYTAQMLLFLDAAEPLKKRYAAAGIDSRIYWDSMHDLTCKLYECYELHGIWGTHVAEWHCRFFNLTRFALGRMQYELNPIPGSLAGACLNGYTYCAGNQAVNLHIPSIGSFRDEDRWDSYRRAFRFYESLQQNGKLALMCHSWLLYPPYGELFGESSHVTAFQHDFPLILREDSVPFHDAWRVFGHYANRPLEEYPTDTSMRRKLVDHAKTGKPFGCGLAALVLSEELLQEHGV